MSTTRRISRALVAATAAAAPVVVLAPAGHAAPASPTLPTVETTVTRWVSASSGVNVRSGPGNTYTVVGGKSYGTQLTGTYTSNGWFKIGESQYVAGSNLTSTNLSSGSSRTTDPSSTPSTSTSTVTRWVASTVGANVRSGPSTSYAVVGLRNYQAKVTGTLTSNGWVKLSDGNYISGSTLTSTDPSGGTSSGGDTGSTGTASSRWVNVPAANVRSGPGTSYAVVGSRSYGDQVNGTLLSSGWFKMVDGTHIAGNLLTTTDPSGGGNGDRTAPTSVTRWVSVPAANVRSGPSTAYSIMGTKTLGTKVTGTVSTDGWIQLGGGGYMSSTVLTTTEPATAPAPATDVSAVRAAILANAAKYVGSPYLLYGTPPDYFDCSAYTWYVYKLSGVDIPRTVWQQKAAVTPVSDPQPGDLVFFDDYYHVALYAGNGMWYEARNARVGVVYNPAWTTRVWYGRINGL